MSLKRGDTIVEVMLAMSVIGIVIGAAFGIANRSIAAGQDAQERTEALKIAETQLEILKSRYKDEVAIRSRNELQPFCFDMTDVGGSIAEVTSQTCDDVNSAGGSGIYSISIIPPEEIGDTTGSHEIKVSWEGFGGVQSENSLTLYFKLRYDGNLAAAPPTPPTPPAPTPPPTPPTPPAPTPPPTPPVVIPPAAPPATPPSGSCTRSFGTVTQATNGEQLTLITTSSDRICITSMRDVRLVVYGPYGSIRIGEMIYDASRTPGGSHRDGTWQRGGGDRAVYIRGGQRTPVSRYDSSLKAGLMEIDNLEVYNSAEDGIQITGADIRVNRFIMRNVWAGNTGIYDPALGSAAEQSPHTDGIQAQGSATITINNFDIDTVSWAGLIGHNGTTEFGRGPIRVYLSNGRIARIGSTRLPASAVTNLTDRARNEGKLFQHVGGNGIRFYGNTSSPNNNNELHLDRVTIDSSISNGFWLGPDIRAWSVRNSTMTGGVRLYSGWTPPRPTEWSNNTILNPRSDYYRGP